MLILFDIDGTLLLTEGAGLKAMATVGESMRGAPFEMDGIDYAGRLDPLIWWDVARRNGIDGEARHDEFRAAYASALADRFAANPTARLLPGVEALVDAFDADERATLGLLTGNYPETGRLKILTAGLQPDRFQVASWGSDGSTRRDLPAVALARYETQFGHPIRPDQAVVIGDTPHDIDCARHAGCHVIAVATGPMSTRDELEAHAPDLLLDDLSGTESIVQWVSEVCEPVRS